MYEHMRTYVGLGTGHGTLDHTSKLVFSWGALSVISLTGLCCRECGDLNPVACWQFWCQEWVHLVRSAAGLLRGVRQHLCSIIFWSLDFCEGTPIYSKPPFIHVLLISSLLFYILQPDDMWSCQQERIKANKWFLQASVIHNRYYYTDSLLLTIHYLLKAAGICSLCIL